jgi:HPt (histidine-containing phosphotransfer) domain-containing protein
MPVIACTANALPGEADVCFAAGMDDYLAKPVEMAALARVLDKWLPLPIAGGATAAPAGVEAGPPPIEPGPLAELTGGDQAMARDILLEYKTANDADVAALTEALARQDLPAVVRAAHRIKGASRMVGAGALAAVCTSIEQAGRQADWPAVAAEKDRLRREVERLNAYLGALEAGER